MNTAGFRLPPRSDLLTSLIRQSQSLKRFTGEEQEATVRLSRLCGDLDPRLYQRGGLLDEQTLAPFFAEPLPDAPLAAALKTPVRGAAAQSAAEATQSPSRSPAGSLSAARAGRKTLTPATDTAAKRGDAQPHDDTAPRAQQPMVGSLVASTSNQSVDGPLAETIHKNIHVLQETRCHPQEAETRPPKPAEPALESKRATRDSEKNRARAAIQTLNKQPIREVNARQGAAGEGKPKAISRQQAAQTLENKWKHSAWHSPLQRGKGSVIQPPKETDKTDLTVPATPQSESLATMTKKHNEREAPITSAPTLKPKGVIEKHHRDSQASSPPVGHQPGPAVTIEKKLDAQVSRILRPSPEHNTRAQNAMPATQTDAGLPAHRQTMDATDALTAKKTAHFPNEQGDTRAFVSAKADVATQPERLVGLRGLAARATDNNTAMSASDLTQQSATVPQAVASPMRDQTTASAASPAPVSSSTQGPASHRQGVSVSELTELITQEAKRAGIDLEQFQP